MSGLIALLDDVAAIAKVAAASVDDIAAQATKAGMKAAGAVIDDAAVTPKYVHGFAPSRELPIVGKIALGSIKNKLLILLPIALLLSAFAPWLIAPLLMLGGGYLCFEGAEKVWHVFGPSHAPAMDETTQNADAAHLEESKVKGAIKTDFILSAEIMTIALSAIPERSFLAEAAILAIVAVGITVVVYGSVALIVKADDFGLFLARNQSSEILRKLGRGIVQIMPHFLKLLTIVGTAAMIWVGGSIIIHALHELGWHLPSETIHHWAELGSAQVNQFQGFVEWLVTATLDGIVGLALGLCLLPIVSVISKRF